MRRAAQRSSRLWGPGIGGTAGNGAAERASRYRPRTEAPIAYDPRAPKTRRKSLASSRRQ